MPVHDNDEQREENEVDGRGNGHSISESENHEQQSRPNNLGLSHYSGRRGASASVSIGTHAWAGGGMEFSGQRRPSFSEGFIREKCVQAFNTYQTPWLLGLLLIIIIIKPLFFSVFPKFRFFFELLVDGNRWWFRRNELEV